MIATLGFLLLLVLFGDVISAMLAIPIPGAILGLVALSVWFAVHGQATQAIERLFDAIIPHAPLLFVPAAVGIVANVDLIAAAWLPIVAAITVGTALVIIVTGLATQALLRHCVPRTRQDSLFRHPG